MGHSMFDDEEHIETSSDQRLVIMANQIARAFAPQKHAAAVASTAEHIAKFWDPRMRAHIRAHMAEGGSGLHPIAKDAVAALKK